MIEAIQETYLGGSPMTGSVAAKVLQISGAISNERKEFIDLSTGKRDPGLIGKRQIL